MIFAREVNDRLTSLVKKIDKQLEEASAYHKGSNKLGVFVVFLSDDPGFSRRLPDLIAKEQLKFITLGTHNSAAGPPKYRVAKEADLTVVIYADKSNVSANFALQKWGLDDTRSDAILKSLSQVLPKK